MKRTPSVAALEAAFPGKGAALKRLLTDKNAVIEHPAAVALRDACYHAPTLGYMRLEALNAEAGTYGVECAWKESDDMIGPPAFEYLNTGDPYVATIVRFRSGTYAVRCWGDIVERGNYR